jgi:peroxiredoxin Q/BCP
MMTAHASRKVDDRPDTCAVHFVNLVNHVVDLVGLMMGGCYHSRIVPLIDPGKKAPAFALKDQTGKVHKLSDYAGRPVILYFYPKDDTPGCTKETCSFQEYLPKFKPSKAAVLGVSILDEKSKAKFANKYDITFPLLADPEHEVAEKYGVWQQKSFMGRKYMGIARTTYLIGPDGKVQERWDSVNVNEHADEVLAALS